jgi:hypothetical protein
VPHFPVVAISTAPDFPSELSQQPTGVEAVVEGIAGLVHHVAVRSAFPPIKAEIICHGGTCIFDGFEIKRTPVESVVSMYVRLAEIFPNPLTSSWISSGPPLRTTCRFVALVATLAVVATCMRIGVRLLFIGELKEVVHCNLHQEV